MNLHAPCAPAGKNSPPALVAVIVACALVLWAIGAFAATHPELPGWVQLHTVSLHADLDGDGTDDALYLARGQLQVISADGQRYLSPRTWVVTDACIHDFDGDGTNELALIVWKRGSFGTSQPFWIDRDTSAMTQHVFVMHYAQGLLEGVWMSSDLGEDARSVSFDNNGRLHIRDREGLESTWRWGQWGFIAEESDDAASGTAFADVSTGSPQQPSDAGHISSDAERVTLIAVGDNIMHLGICRQMHDERADTYDFSPLYEHVAERISSYDLASVCQETAFVHDRSAVNDYPDFGTPEEAGDALVAAGFDIVASATNHVCDRGLGGLEDTCAFWASKHPDITVLGLHATPEDADMIDYLTCGNMRFALFDATYGLNGHQQPNGQEWRVDTIDDLDRLSEQIKHAEGEADLSVCFLHIGDEYAEEPSDEQRLVVERLVDAGADLVICSHPHIVQPAERVRTDAGAEAVVFWSLGNFASQQTDMRTVLGGAASIAIGRDDNGNAVVESFDLIPTVCHFDAQTTCVYFLEDYTDELASTHYLNSHGEHFTVESLQNLWRRLAQPDINSGQE